MSVRDASFSGERYTRAIATGPMADTLENDKYVDARQTPGALIIRGQKSMIYA